jgi:hypothetical protein
MHHSSVEQLFNNEHSKPKQLNGKFVSTIGFEEVSTGFLKKNNHPICCTNILKVLVLQNLLTNPSTLFFYTSLFSLMITE